MKTFLVAAPLALLLGTAAFAQTSSTGDGTAGNTSDSGAGVPASGSYGRDWSQSIGSTFFTDNDRTQLRTGEEISQGWQSLSQQDRDLVLAECRRYEADAGSAATTGSATATDPNVTSTGDSGAGVAATGGEATGSAAADTGSAKSDAAPLTQSEGDAGGGVETTAGEGTGATGGSTAPEATAISEVVGYDASAMASICPTVQDL